METIMTEELKQNVKKPSHIAYHVRDRENRDGVWTEIGRTWPHADAKGFSVQLETLPLTGVSRYGFCPTNPIKVHGRALTGPPHPPAAS
jgi:hypothetical protein